MGMGGNGVGNKVGMEMGIEVGLGRNGDGVGMRVRV